MKKEGVKKALKTLTVVGLIAGLGAAAGCSAKQGACGKAKSCNCPAESSSCGKGSCGK